jgi:Flp pilus assembly protein TadD
MNQGVDFRKSIEPLEALAKDYPGERLIQVILGQLYAGAGQGDNAPVAFEKAQSIGPTTARVQAFLAGDDLLRGQYAKARASDQAVEKQLPKGSVPFAIRFGVTFSHLYEGNVDGALESLRTYLAEYKGDLENGRLEDAMKAYEKGYESVPGSELPEDQKQTRLRHGKARVLAKMGKHQEAWAEAEAYHYLAGYLKLEAGDYAQAVEHLKQSDPNNPFDTLLLARAYEKLGRKDEARAAYQKVVDLQWPGIERPLAYPEAKRKLGSL